MGYPAFLFANMEYLSERFQKDHSNTVYRFYMKMICISANFRITTPWLHISSGFLPFCPVPAMYLLITLCQDTLLFKHMEHLTLMS